MKNVKLTTIIEIDEDGYFAYCPELQGCYTQGDTYEEAMVNINDAVKLHLEARIANGESLPTNKNISVTSVEMTV